jgi:hypothetical protein
VSAVVSDSSPLNYLALLSDFDLLREIYRNLVIPQAIHHEVVERGSHYPVGKAVSAALGAWISVAEAPDAEQVMSLRREHRLDQGEREAILVAEIASRPSPRETSLARQTVHHALNWIHVPDLLAIEPLLKLRHRPAGRYIGRGEYVMSEREHAHQLIDQLGPAEIDAVVRLLKVMVHQEDGEDEELTEEDRRALRSSDEYFRNGGQGIPFEQVVADLGFTMEQIRGHKGD